MASYQVGFEFRYLPTLAPIHEYLINHIDDRHVHWQKDNMLNQACTKKAVGINQLSKFSWAQGINSPSDEWIYEMVLLSLTMEYRKYFFWAWWLGMEFFFLLLVYNCVPNQFFDLTVRNIASESIRKKLIRRSSISLVRIKSSFEHSFL